MSSGSNASEVRTGVEVNGFDDVSTWARRAGIAYPTFIEPGLRATFEALAPRPDDPAEPHEPLFYLLVPLRFVLGRKPSATCFQFVTGKKLRDGGITVRVDFRSDEVRGDYFSLSAGANRDQP